MFKKNLFIGTMLLCTAMVSQASYVPEQEQAQTAVLLASIVSANETIMAGIHWLHGNTPQQINSLKESLEQSSRSQEPQSNPAQFLAMSRQLIQTQLLNTAMSVEAKGLMIRTTLSLMIKNLRTLPDAAPTVLAIEQEINRLSKAVPYVPSSRHQESSDLQPQDQIPSGPVRLAHGVLKATSRATDLLIKGDRRFFSLISLLTKGIAYKFLGNTTTYKAANVALNASNLYTNPGVTNAVTAVCDSCAQFNLLEPLKQLIQRKSGISIIVLTKIPIMPGPL